MFTIIIIFIVFRTVDSLSYYQLTQNSSFLEAAASVNLGGYPINGPANEDAMKGICLNHLCKQQGGVIKNGRCQAAFKCKSCSVNEKFANAKLTSQYCQDLAPPKYEGLVLANGYFRGDEKLKGRLRRKDKETIRLDVAWGDPDAIVDITHCGPDDFSESLAKKIERDPKGQTLPLHIPLVMVVTAMKVKQHIINPDIQLEVFYNPPPEDLTLAGNYKGGGTCPKLKSAAHISGLNDGELTNLITSFTVPWERTGLTPSNFEVRLTCMNRLSGCDTSNYRFCFRVMCRTMRTDVAKKILMLQALIANPPELPEEEKEEEEEEEEASPTQPPFPAGPQAQLPQAPGRIQRYRSGSSCSPRILPISCLVFLVAMQ